MVEIIPEHSDSEFQLKIHPQAALQNVTARREISGVTKIWKDTASKTHKSIA